jgi:hypothetical protein
MVLQFPSSPSVNSVFNYNNSNWRWDGTRWLNLGNSGGSGLTGSTGSATNTVPIISSLTYTNSGYTANAATSVSASTGGYFKLTGTGFASGCAVYINSVAATTTTYVSATTVNVAVPAITAGTYTVLIKNSDGGIAALPNSIRYV